MDLGRGRHVRLRTVRADRLALAAAPVVAGVVLAAVAGGGWWPGAGARTAAPAAASAVAAPSTPSVPSAPSARATTPAPWRVVGLGDSVTSGHGCDCDFVADYARLTAKATGRTVTSRNLGVDGWTSADLVDALAGDTAQAGAVRDADIVLVTIGANDFYRGLGTWQDSGCTGGDCFTADAATVRGNVAKIVEEVRALRAGAPTQVLVTDYWNVFEDGSRAVRDHGRSYLDVARTATAAANAAIVAGARAGGATPVDLLGPFERADGGVDALLQDDGDHPDDDGHALIARTLAEQGWTAFRT